MSQNLEIWNVHYWKRWAGPCKRLNYRRNTNLACGGAKGFSHPPYSQHDFIYFETESGFEHFGDFDAAPPRRFLNFYLEPPNLPPFNPKMTTPREPKNWWNFFSWFLIIFLLISVIWCFYTTIFHIFLFCCKIFSKSFFFVPDEQFSSVTMW